VQDVKLVNLTYVSEVKVVKEADREVSPQPLPNINVQKVRHIGPVILNKKKCFHFFFFTVKIYLSRSKKVNNC